MTRPHDRQGGPGLTGSQRRAYIDTSRRSQPIEELRRKARKAAPKGWGESADLSLAESHAWYVRSGIEGRANPKLATMDTHFCSLCSRFGKQWDAETKTYRQPVQHEIRCSRNPIDDGPYPGWSAAARAALAQHGESADG